MMFSLWTIESMGKVLDNGLIKTFYKMLRLFIDMLPKLMLRKILLFMDVRRG